MSNAFVIHIHSGHGPLHYDLMLERDGSLETWQLSHRPDEMIEGQSIDAKKIADHRLAYLDYEGPISDDRGRVKRLDKGSYNLLEATKSHRLIHLKGQLIQGRFELRHKGPEIYDWILSKS